MKCETLTIAVILTVVCFTGVSQAEGGVKASGAFPERAMRSLILPIENGDFSVFERKKGEVEFRGWAADTAHDGRRVSVSKGYDRFLALTVVNGKEGGKNEEDGVTRLSNRVYIPSEWQSDEMNVSVSAWIWSDEPLSTFMEIISSDSTSVSAYHPGNGKWEYLTVVFPFSRSFLKGGFTVSLVSRKGTSKFSSVRPVVLIDDRFDGLKDIELRFRERLTYRKGGRIRVAIVGNSTIWGTGAPRNATISYILQSKLESLYPGRFEVVNYGIGCWSLTNQIVSIKNNFVYKTWCNTADSRLTHDNIRDSSISLVKGEDTESVTAHQSNAVTLAELKPDMILMGSLWNDVIYTLFFDNWPANSATFDGVPLLNLYYRALYNYMDNPTAENHEIASLIYEMAAGNGEGAKGTLAPKHEKDVVGNDGFGKLEKIARLKQDFLVNEFLTRVDGSARLVLFNLPSKDAGRTDEMIDKAPWFLSRGAFLISDTSKETLKGYFHIFDTTSYIDETVFTDNSKKHGLPFWNTKKTFVDEHKGVTVADYVNMEYFHDTIHFTYRGNQWIADRIFMYMQEQFAEMAAKK